LKKPLSNGFKVNHPWRKLGMLVVLGLAVHLLLPQIASLEHSWYVLTSMTTWAVGLAILAQVLSYISSGYLLKTIFGLARQKVSLLRSTLIFVGAASIGLVAGGMVGSGAAIYTWTNKGENRHVSATLAGVLPPMLNNLMLMLVSVFGLIHLLIIHDLSRVQAIGFGAILSILGLFAGSIALALRYQQRATGAAIWIASHLARLRRKHFDPSTTQASIQNLFEAWDSLRDGHWRRLLLGAILTVVFDMLTLFFLFIAAGHSISPGMLLAGYGLPLLLGKIAFVVPGGIGVVEGSMVALYNGLGVPDAISGIVVLSYRLISFWLPILLGFPVAAYMGRQMRTARPSNPVDILDS